MGQEDMIEMGVALQVLLTLFLVSGTICFLLVSWLMALSLRASGKTSTYADTPEVVLVPVQGPMGSMGKPPTSH